jgi:exodeoxyribonuclease VII small subunit
VTERRQPDDIPPADSSPAGSRPGEQELSYEQAREELVEVVRRLETGGTSLEDSLALWERGEKLAQICQSWLDGAKKRLDAAISAGETNPEQ